MQHAIGDHAPLADGHTAALVDPDGDVVWLCWPRFDSRPCLMSILDTRLGGTFRVRPARPDARVVSRRYHPGTLVLETTWQAGEHQLVVDDALLMGERHRLVRRLRSKENEVEVEARFRLAEGAAPGLSIDAPSGWEDTSGARVSRFVVHETPTVLTLRDSSDAHAAVGTETISSTLDCWRALTHQLSARLSRLCDGSAHDSTTIRELLMRSACVLIGLSSRGGIVAAPTTSLPQWPGTSRTWDYLFCWLRDAALAATALLRLGFDRAARRIAAALARRVLRGEPLSLTRLDGRPPPREHTLSHLDGYHGARPVRIGNAASEQLQVDIAGEFTQLGRALADADALSPSMSAACSRIVAWAAARWADPDHGIWEIRGAPRRYTHSRVMAWTALRDGAELVDAGVISGDAAAWRAAAAEIHSRVMRSATPALQLTDRGGGPDSALACVPLVGFLPPDHPTVTATLDLIEQRLDRNGLLDRCLNEEEASPEPCGPFLFPTFWMASALDSSGRSGRRHFDAALASRGPLGLFGEVADPSTLMPLGNYPHVQSHASFVLAATAAPS